MSHSQLLSSLCSRAGDVYNYFSDGEVAYGPLHSIIRHPRPFVIYQGVKTGVTLTILGSEELPGPRHVFLQRRGYRTGFFGWTVGSLLGGSHLPGIDVTPMESFTKLSLPKKQHQQLERDFFRLFHPALSHTEEGSRMRQRPLETVHVHIPVRAEDGYYRLRVTSDSAGKNEIAVSPSFRLGSISWASACPRGATPIGIVPELLVRSSFEVARTAAYASFYAAFPIIKLAEWMPGPWRAYAMRALYSRALTDDQQTRVTDTVARGRESVQNAQASILQTVPFGSVGIRSQVDLQRDREIGRGGWFLKW